MKIYIAGPMTGYPKYNFPMFDECKFYLLKTIDTSLAVLSPADINRANGIHEDSEVDNKLLRNIFAKDVLAIAACDRMVMLPNWQMSRGARIEYQIARYLGLVIERYEPATMTNKNAALFPIYDTWFDEDGLFGMTLKVGESCNQ